MNNTQITKNYILGNIDGIMKGFYLGQLEGQMLRNMANRWNLADRADELIIALNQYNFSDKRVRENYQYILNHKNDALKIADFLCAINWMGGLYHVMASEGFTATRKNFMLNEKSDIEYMNKASDYYSFAYEYLWNRFLDDTSISQEVKSTVIRVND